MSEQKRPFMVELDEWTQEVIIDPLHQAVMNGTSDECDGVCGVIKKAVRTKVLDSYRNGQKSRVAAQRGGEGNGR